MMYFIPTCHYSAQRVNFVSTEVTLRGFVITKEDGSFSFKSIVPGLYGSRPKHIHYRISTSSFLKKDFVTQSYFKGDPRIEHDQLARDANECRVISLEEKNGVMEGLINFHI